MGKIFEGVIREYDMEKSNISLLFEAGVINEAEYNKISNMSKINRQIHIGCMIRDNKELQKTLNENMKKYIDMFKSANNILDSDIDEIAKDALWIKNKYITVNSFDTKIRFRSKQQYDTMYAVNDHLKFYYNSLTDASLVRGCTVTDDTKEFFNFILMVIKTYKYQRSCHNMIHRYRINYLYTKHETFEKKYDLLTKQVVKEQDKHDNNLKIMSDMIQTFIK